MNHILLQKAYILIIVLATVGLACTKEELRLHPHPQSVELAEEDAALSLPYKRSENVPTFYLLDEEEGLISETAIIEVFRSGWQYEEAVVIAGYTATDDLWTVIGFKPNDPPRSFPIVRIELTDIEAGTPDEEACVADIYEFAKELPGSIIVLDQDLE